MVEISVCGGSMESDMLKGMFKKTRFKGIERGIGFDSGTFINDMDSEVDDEDRGSDEGVSSADDDEEGVVEVEDCRSLEGVAITCEDSRLLVIGLEDVVSDRTD